jgi:hypothetical protein
MNKAFIKEPENTGPAPCPRCGSLGTAVSEPTLEAQLGPALLATIAKAAYFCSFATCPVVYFDAFDRVVTVDQLSGSVYPKDPDAPICACFGVSTDEIDQYIAEGGVRRTRELLARAKSPEAQCLTKSASGESCIAAVQRYYMQHRQGS